jgi:hypothetical protein
MSVNMTENAKRHFAFPVTSITSTLRFKVLLALYSDVRTRLLSS